VLVSEVPGTTRDAVDVVMVRDEVRYRFVDTAGIRRKGRTDTGPEVLSVVAARKSLERSHLCLLVVDATEGLTRQDAHVAGYAWEAGRALGVVVNKWDLVEDRENEAKRLGEAVARDLAFARSSPLAFVSALTGRGVHRLYPMMIGLSDGRGFRPTTSELNRVLRDAWQRRPPPSAGRQEPRLFYSTQLKHPPPSFLLFTNVNRKLHFSYQRYLENVLRETFGLAGVPIRVMIKGRDS
jgi:GTP-binding protein